MGYFRQISREKGEIGSVKKRLMKENTKKSKKVVDNRKILW